MNINNIYPWQSDIWQRLSSDKARLPHALLLRGRNGIGKLDFSLQLAKYLLCYTPSPDQHACGLCPSCGWFEQNNHPDYRLLTPEQELGDNEDVKVSSKKTAKKSQISVTQIRELSNFLELSSHHGGGLRIALIHPAETLNASSANALLKMLEEPPSDVVFLLVSHQPQRLLPTILSRCQKIDMPVPETDVALQWLRSQGIKTPEKQLSYSGGAPLSVLEYGEEGISWLDNAVSLLKQGSLLNPFVAGPLFSAQGMENAIHAMQKWIYDLLACRLIGTPYYHPGYMGALQELSKRVDLSPLLDFQQRLNEARKSAAHPLSNELQLESLLLQYTQLFRQVN